MAGGRAWGLALALVAGCTTSGDSPFSANDAGPITDAEISDAPVPDALVCDPLVAPATGAPCTDATDCGTESLCLREALGWPDVGYCTNTCTGDDDCGVGATCSPDIPSGTTPTRVCLADCCGTSCGQADHLCQSKLLALIDLPTPACLPGVADGADGDGCTTFGDCAESSLCLNNPFNNPGGYCVKFGCTVDDDSSCSPGGTSQCIDVAADTLPPFCVDACIIQPECRSGYACVDPDGAGAVGQICVAVNSGVGSACSGASCGPAPWVCLQGAGFPGGYCGADDCDPTDPNTCPNASVCFSPGGEFGGDQFCVQLCDPAATPPDCRTGEGYSCTDLGDGTVFGCL